MIGIFRRQRIKVLKKPKLRWIKTIMLEYCKLLNKISTNHPVNRGNAQLRYAIFLSISQY